MTILIDICNTENRLLEKGKTVRASIFKYLALRKTISYGITDIKNANDIAIEMAMIHSKAQNKRDAFTKHVGKIDIIENILEFQEIQNIIQEGDSYERECLGINKLNQLYDALSSRIQFYIPRENNRPFIYPFCDLINIPDLVIHLQHNKNLQQAYLECFRNIIFNIVHETSEENMAQAMLDYLILKAIFKYTPEDQNLVCDETYLNFQDSTFLFKNRPTHWKIIERLDTLCKDESLAEKYIECAKNLKKVVLFRSMRISGKLFPISIEPKEFWEPNSINKFTEGLHANGRLYITFKYDFSTKEYNRLTGLQCTTHDHSSFRLMNVTRDGSGLHLTLHTSSFDITRKFKTGDSSIFRNENIIPPIKALDFASFAAKIVYLYEKKGELYVILQTRGKKLDYAFALDVSAAGYFSPNTHRHLLENEEIVYHDNRRNLLFECVKKELQEEISNKIEITALENIKYCGIVRDSIFCSTDIIAVVKGDEINIKEDLTLNDEVDEISEVKFQPAIVAEWITRPEYNYHVPSVVACLTYAFECLGNGLGQSFLNEMEKILCNEEREIKFPIYPKEN